MFTLHTANCRESHDNCIIDKYADNTALTRRITKGNDSHYRHEIDNFVDWCDKNYLVLNVDQTKEIVIDVRKKKVVLSPVIIKGAEDEWLETYKYLGIVLDNALRWKENTDAIIKRADSCLYCLRTLRSFGVSSQLLQMFYTSMVSSVFTYGLTCWGWNVSKQDNSRMD